MTAKSIMHLINLVIALVGVIFTMVSVGVKHNNEKKIKRCKVLTKGIVVGMQKEEGTSNMDGVSTFSWYPVYEYSVGEQTIRKRSYFGQSRQIFYPGEEVDLYYNADDYNEFYVPKENAGRLGLIFQVIGGALLLLGVILVLVIRML